MTIAAAIGRSTIKRHSDLYLFLWAISGNCIQDLPFISEAAWSMDTKHGETEREINE